MWLWDFNDCLCLPDLCDLALHTLSLLFEEAKIPPANVADKNQYCLLHLYVSGGIVAASCVNSTG